MPRASHPIRYRDWALGRSPAQLRRVALDSVEAFASALGAVSSPAAVGLWKIGVLGAESRAEPEQLRSWIERFAQDKAAVRDFLSLGAVAHKFSDNTSPRVVCDRPPYFVPVDYVHLFDWRPTEIRQALLKASEEVQGEGVLEILRQTSLEAPKVDNANYSKVCLVYDFLVAFHFRFFGGLAIQDSTVQFWIAFNVDAVRTAVNPTVRQAAQRSLETIFEAMLPSEYAKKTPEAAGLSREYVAIRDRAMPVLRKNFRNVDLKRSKLRKIFSEVDAERVNRWVDCSPKGFALKLLSHKYSLQPGYLANLIKRGNLAQEIAGVWYEALQSIPTAPPFPPSSADVNPETKS